MLSKFFRRSQQGGGVLAQAPPPANRHTVLLVDDDAHLRELFRLSLEHKGYTVRTGTNGAEAVKLAREDPPDLIILDGNMPVMDGLDALKKLRTSRGLQNIPVIMLTMRSHQVDMITGYRFGAQEYLTKPIAIEQLLVTVKKVLDGR
jgi:two-component system alkaline phosphatase synthesis response regulator PhoP